jgi:hypothetical protein
MYDIHKCFICRPSDSTVSEEAGIEPRTVATMALAVRRANHSAIDSIADDGAVRRGCKWCGVAVLVARRLAVRQARVRFSARHHREVIPLSLPAMKRWRETSANGDG